MSGKDFNSWAFSDLREKKIVDQSEDIWCMPWFDDLMEKIENNGNTEEFINLKNKNLYERYAAEEISPYEKEVKLSQTADHISKLKKQMSKATEMNMLLDAFEKDVDALVAQYPPERQSHIKQMLDDYRRKGTDAFKSNNFSCHQLKQPPKGFFNKIKNGKKIKNANKHLDKFIEKYKQTNLNALYADLSEEERSDFHSLSSKFEAIANLDKKKTEETSEWFAKNLADKQKSVSFEESYFQNKMQYIENLKLSFSKNEKISQEDEKIRSFAQRTRDEIQNPKQYKATDYIEGMEGLQDDEKIMFNLRFNPNTEKAVKNILAYNGLKTGHGTDEWLIRKETRNNSDQNMYEAFSPIMTVKDAKEIMPKLIHDFDQAKVISGIVIPARPKEMFKNISKESLSQDTVDKELSKLILGTKFRDSLNNRIIFEEEQKKAIMRELEINSVEDLPRSYGSIEELKKQYPKDKYLFSGTMASDDFCQLSGRIGRNGIVYATPDLNYASIYDGATDIGRPMGVSATGDAYVSTAMGKYNGKNVYVGFINVYQQSEQDKFFSNFGIEDYNRNADPHVTPRSYDLWEPSPDGAVLLNKQGMTPAANNMLTRDQAINGYVDPHSSRFTINGKVCAQPSYNAETFVTPEKNPLKAKIMHIAYETETNTIKNIYIPIPDNPDEVTKYILSSRQADMKDTFCNADNAEVLLRFQKQKEEFDKGLTPLMREPDYLNRKQEILRSGKNSAAQTEEKNAVTAAVNININSNKPNLAMDTDLAANTNNESKTDEVQGKQDLTAKTSSGNALSEEEKKKEMRKIILQKRGCLPLEQKPRLQSKIPPNTLFYMAEKKRQETK